MTNPEIDEWIRTAPGVPMNPDNYYGLQCVDLANQYAMDIFGIAARVAMTGVTGAKQLLDAASDDYFIRTDNDPNSPNLIPKRGDVVVWGGSALNQWGHVAVVESADINGMWVVQQDGFAAPLKWANGAMYSNKPAHRAYLPYYGAGTGMVLGWLTPRENKIVGYKAPAPAPTPKPTLSGGQRVTGPSGANYRTGPTTDSEVTKTFTSGDVLNFVGFVHGSTPAGGTSDVWLKGTGGGFVHVSAVEPSNADGLPDLTPAAKPAPTAPSVTTKQKIVGNSGVNYRKSPSASGELIQLFNPADVLHVKGFIRGESVNGNNIWFVGALTGGYIWSGGVTDGSTNGLPDLTPKAPEPTPAPAPKPAPVIPTPAPAPAPVTGPKVVSPDGLECVTEWIPAHPDNYEVGNFPGLATDGGVVHQFGVLGIGINSVISYFQMSLADRIAGELRANPNKVPTVGPSSAHFEIEDKRIVQMVSLNDRAYHSGKGGNDWIGIETSPAQSAETIASVNKLLAELYSKGYRIKLWKHKDVPGNATQCGSLIDLNNYHAVPLSNTAPVPTDTTVKIPVASVALIQKYLKDIDNIIQSFNK